MEKFIEYIGGSLEKFLEDIKKILRKFSKNIVEDYLRKLKNLRNFRETFKYKILKLWNLKEIVAKFFGNLCKIVEKCWSHWGSYRVILSLSWKKFRQTEKNSVGSFRKILKKHKK